MYSRAHHPESDGMRRWLVPQKENVSGTATQHLSKQSSEVKSQSQTQTNSNNAPSTSTHQIPPTSNNKVKLFIAASSLTKGIDRGRFNYCLPLEDSTARIQSWPGARARHLKEYISCHVEEEKPTGVIVQAGGTTWQS